MSTMPESVAASMLSRSEKNSDFVNYILEAKKIFEENIKSHSHTDIIKIPDIRRVREGNVRLDFLSMLGIRDVFYTTEEFRKHLENVIMYLKRFENYHVVLDIKGRKEKYILSVKEDSGAVVIKTWEPFVVFAINESNLRVSLWDYLQNMVEDYPYDKDDVIRRLEEIVEELK